MIEEEHNVPNEGFSGMIKRILFLVSQVFATKLELLGVELQEEKYRIVHLLILASATLLFGALGLTVITFGIITLLLDTGQIAILFVVGILYALIAMALFLCLRRKLYKANLVFEATTEELKKDIEWVKHDH